MTSSEHSLKQKRHIEMLLIKFSLSNNQLNSDEDIYKKLLQVAGGKERIEF